MQIRRVERKDLLEVAKIKVETWQQSYDGIINKKYLENMDYKKIAEKWSKNFNNENFLVVVENEKILGFCRYGDRGDEFDRFREYDGEIYAIYISEKYAKKGIGKKLVASAMEDLKKQHKNKVIIWCLEQNIEAQKFYNRIGGNFLGKKQAKIGDELYKEVAYGYEIL